MNNEVTLVIFTCESREQLLQQTIASFKQFCNYAFDKVILSIDGEFDQSAASSIAPQLVVHHRKRMGYVNSISQILKLIDTPCFFWLEDDWKFHREIDIQWFLSHLLDNKNWAEIVLSKYGPLTNDVKIKPLGDNLYQSPFGFSANPCLCNTEHIRSAFELLLAAPKGITLGEDGFENFLTRHFASENVLCVISDPVSGEIISHSGYLETTPRGWHMTGSLEAKPSTYLSTIPRPSMARRILMMFKLFRTLCLLAVKQLWSDEVYEHCFRIVTSTQVLKKHD